MIKSREDRETAIARSIRADGDRTDYAAGVNRGRLIEFLRIKGERGVASPGGIQELRNAADEAAAALHRGLVETFPVGAEVTMTRNGHSTVGICKEVLPRSLMVEFDSSARPCEVDLRWLLGEER